MANWIKARRVFFASVGTILSLHFTLMYLFIREQFLVANNPPKSSSDFPFYAKDERSPLEMEDNTGWGIDFHDSRLRRRRLESNDDNDPDKMPHSFSNQRRHVLKQVPLAIPPSQNNSFKANDRLNQSNQSVLNTSMHQDGCFSSRPPDEEMEEPLQWQQVVPGSVYVFSAYLDVAPTGQGRLVVIGLADPGLTLDHHTYFCQVWYRNNGLKSNIVPATISRLAKDTNNKVHDVIFHCPANPKRDPLAVSIVNRKSCARIPPNLLYIRNIDEAQGRTRLVNNVTVCIPPLRTRYNDTKALVETAEISFLLGAGRVVFYDQDTTDEVKSCYNSYKHDDTATVIPWALPRFLPKSKTYLTSEFAVVAALNDCLYRFHFTSRYIIFGDIGHIIVPENTPNWNGLVSKLEQIQEMSVFLFKGRSDDIAKTANESLAEKNRFKLVSKASLDSVMSPGTISAYMVRPTDVDMVGRHDAILKRRGGTLVVDVTDASVRNYRRPALRGGATVHGSTRVQANQGALSRRVETRLALVRGKA